MPSTVATPPNWSGTDAEWIVYTTLQNIGKQPNRDFIYRSGNQDRDAAFRFVSPRNLAINVVGTMQDHIAGVQNGGLDMLSRQQLLGSGVQLIFIDDVDLLQDPTYYVEEALEYRDHSHMAG
jgi:hypothetical protein